MPTKLTAPVVDTITDVTVQSWSLSLSYKANLSLDAAGTLFEIVVTDRRADGSAKQNRNLVLTAATMTAPQISVLRTFHAQVVALARSAGLLPAGADSNDI